MDQKQIRKTYSRIGLALAAFVVLQQVLATVVALLAERYAPQLVTTGWFGWAASYLPMYLIAFPVFLLIVRTIPSHAQKPTPAEPLKLGAGKIALLVIGSYGMVYVLNIVSTLLSSFVAGLQGGEAVNPLAAMTMASNPLVNFFVVVLVAPVMEEIIFRGILYKKLAPFGDKAYVFCTALLFGLFHGNIYQFPYAFLLGLLIATVYCMTGKLLYPILLHILINFLGTGVGTIILGYGNETALGIWGLMALAIVAVGIVLDIVWLVKGRKMVRYSPAEVPVPKRSLKYANVGMILYFVVTGALILLVLFAPWF